MGPNNTVTLGEPLGFINCYAVTYKDYLQGLPTRINYKDYLQGLTIRITYKDYLQGLPTIVSCYAAVMGINKGSLLGILNSIQLWQTSTSIPRKFPIIPQKFQIINSTEVSDNTTADTGTYDNTTEVPDN